MLSPINKDSFNIDISKIKLNNKEPFQEKKESNKFEFDATKVDEDIIYLILNRTDETLDIPIINKNDIIKFFYNNNDIFYYFKIEKVDYLTNNNYKLKIPGEDYDNKVVGINKLKESGVSNISITVEGNTNENCIISSGLILTKSTISEIDYEIKFPESQKEDIVNIFSEGDVIELLPSDNKTTSQLKIKDDKDNNVNSNNKFLINKIDKTDNKFKLNSSEIIELIDSANNQLDILKDKEFLIKKVDLKNTIKNYYEDKKDFYIEHLLIKNKAKNLGIIIDKLKEDMGRI